MSRTADDNTTGKKDFANTDSESGPTFQNIQREVNSLNSYTGRPSESAHDATPTWTNNDVGLSGNNLKARAEALTAAFNATLGHKHDGTAGSGGTISASDLDDINYFRATRQTTVVSSGTGSSLDITTEMVGKSPGGDAATTGVVTDSPRNKTWIVDDDDETQVVDAGGQAVYGRITEAAGTWTLSYYTLESSVETPYTFSSSVDIRIYFTEVFTLASLPTFPEDAGYVESLDKTADTVDATTTQRGLMNTTAQSFNGNKTWEGFMRMRAAIHFQEINNAQSGTGITLTNPAVGIIRLTNASLISFEGVSAPSLNQVIAIFNVTGNDVVIENDAAAIAADGILTGTGSDFDFVADAAILIMYDVTTARWRMIGGGGSGSGGGALVVSGTRASPTAITAGGGIAFVSTDARNMYFIEGSSAGITDITANPQIAVGVTVGQELVLVGRNNSNTVLVQDGNGLSLNGEYEMGEDSVLNLVWDGVNWVETSRRE